ncbi:MAG: polysaccharide biosynthesis protein [Firmicutes bacterium]|nr:polysaccharide biosynthesis protein [Bacillota bacterium]
MGEENYNVGVDPVGVDLQIDPPSRDFGGGKPPPYNNMGIGGGKPPPYDNAGIGGGKPPPYKPASAKNKVLTGAGILAVCALVAKLIGAMYRIPLTNIVGAEGIGLYQMVFPLYTVLLTVSSGGLPVAISRVVASRIANGDEHGARKVLFTSLLSLSLIGLAASALVFFFRGQIAAVQGNPAAALPYLGIAPSITFVAVISCFRGYYQGKQNMLPSALSQLSEQAIKLAAGLTLARVMLPLGVEYGVLGALLGVSVSELATMLLLLGQFFFTNRQYRRKTRIPVGSGQLTADGGQLGSKNEKRKTKNEKLRGKERSGDRVLENVGCDALIAPQDISNRRGHSLVRPAPLVTNAEIAADTAINGNLLGGSPAVGISIAPTGQSRRTPNPESSVVAHSSLLTPHSVSKRSLLAEIYRVAIPVTLGSLVIPLTQVVDSILVINLLVARGVGRTDATGLFGLLTGPVGTLLNMPAVITLSLAVALLPKISECITKKESVCGSVGLSLKYSFVLGLFASLLFAVFGGALFSLLYAGGLSGEEIRVGTTLLWVGSVSVLYVSLLQVATGVLQGANKAHKPAVNLLWGAAVKIILTVALLPGFGMAGVMAASCACYGVTCVLDVRDMLKVAPIRLKIREFFLGPLLAGGGFAAAGVILVKLFSRVLPGLWGVTAAFVIALVVFCALLFPFGTIKADELRSLPVIGKLFKTNNEKRKTPDGFSPPNL